VTGDIQELIDTQRQLGGANHSRAEPLRATSGR
jgi:hypothetical protein